MFNGSPPAEYAKMLRDDLTLLSKVDCSHSPLAAQYLEHMANLREADDLGENDLWQGAFDPQHPLTKGQSKVLRKLERGDDLIAVQGGPGTGKTTLFLSIIANRLVRRAVQLASTGKDMNTLMIIVSTSNKAVDSATKDFLDKDEFKGLNHFYFIGGKREKISNSISRMKRLIEDLKTAQWDKETYEKTKQVLLTAADDLSQPFIEYRWIRNEYQQLLAKGEQLFGGETHDDWESWVREKADALFNKVAPLGHGDNKPQVLGELKRWLQEQQTVVQQYHDRLWTLQQRYPKANIEVFDPEAREVKEMVASLEDVKEHLDGIPRWKFEFFFKERFKIFTKWKNRYHHVLKTVDNDWPSLGHKDVAKLMTTVNSVQRDTLLLKRLEPNMTLLTADLKGLANETESIAGKAEEARDMLLRLAELQERLVPFESPNFVEYYRLKTVSQQRQLYELALKFLSLEMVRRKKEVINVLQDWQDLLNGNNEYKVS
jgi:hypothetical protein